MADAYQGLSAAGDIGALLRMIQEEKSNSILNAPPSVDPNSPLREVVQGPVISPESPGSTRVTSLRPEGAPSATGQAGPISQSQVVGPIAPVIPTPVPTPARPSAPGGNTPSTAPAGPASPIAQLAKSLPNIGTTIRTAASVLGNKTSAKTPTRSTIGSPIVNVNPKKTAIPTPTPEKKPTTSTKRNPGYVGYIA